MNYWSYSASSSESLDVEIPYCGDVIIWDNRCAVHRATGDYT